MSLVIVGSVAYDAIETPFGKTDKILGGAGTYIGLATSYFTKKSKLISVVGGDFSDDDLQLLKDHNIDIEGIQVKKDKKTFFWSGRYHTNMNCRDTLATELNVLGEFDPIVPDSYQDADFLVLGNLSPVVQRKVIERVKNRPRLVVMDTMNFWMNTMLDELLRTIKMVDVLAINDEEARQLSGEYSLVTAARKILKMGPKYLIIKKGEHGALLFNENEMFYAPAMPLEQVFDPTGAGDTFAGGFAGYLYKQKDINFRTLKNAVIVGSAIASLSVEKFGTTRLHYIKNEVINNRIRDFIKLTQFDSNLEL